MRNWQVGSRVLVGVGPFAVALGVIGGCTALLGDFSPGDRPGGAGADGGDAGGNVVPDGSLPQESGSSFDAAGDGATSLDGGADGATSSVDAGADVVTIPTSGFTLTLQPAHINADPGDTTSIAIAILRAQSFTDDVSFTVASSDPSVAATTPVDTGNGGSSSSFSVGVADDAGLGDCTITVTASNPGKSYVVNGTLGVHVGTLLPIEDGGIVIPSYATAIIVKAWGAGGGGGGALNGYAGGVGGGGGYAYDILSVTPGETFLAFVGTGGGGGVVGQIGEGTGGGGGGYTGLCLPSGACVVIAGGGGGGTVDLPGTPGAPGGGAAGGDAPEGGLDLGGQGGTQTAGGAAGGACANGLDPSTPSTPGTSLQGGDGCYYTGLGGGGAGGLPGGGQGGNFSANDQGPSGGNFGGAGGGGGGYFGGGGGGAAGTAGGNYSTAAGAGGGGSGYVGDAGMQLVGNGAMPPNMTDPDYASGVGVGGVPGGNGIYPGVNGGSGLLIVRLTKP